MNNGAIKKIDELGRIVIPKEIRKRLSIKTDDSLEISIDGNNISITKAVAIKNYKECVLNILNVITNNCDIKILATTRDEVIFNNTDIDNFDVKKYVNYSLYEINDNKIEFGNDCDLRPIIIDSNVEGLILVKGSCDNKIVGQILNILFTSKLDITC